jgi:NAD(P)-dependent dehydrogenase (short-subunit alcohol dehydrogenase family)
MSSGAAHFGSPLSGGSAGAKAAIRVLCSYAADESCRAGLDIRFVSVLPKLTPATDPGAVAVAAYAKRDGIDLDEFLRQQGPAPEPEHVGGQIADLASSTEPAGAYLLTPAGLSLLR